jgi:hypothetical protein
MSGLPDIGMSSDQVGYSRLRWRVSNHEATAGPASFETAATAIRAYGGLLRMRIEGRLIGQKVSCPGTLQMSKKKFYDSGLRHLLAARFD